MSNSLHELNAAGQSIWLDYIDRDLVHGDLARRVRDDALTGMTSNPTIFEKALSSGSTYDEQIRSAPGELTADELFELIATTDVRDACDVFAGVYERTGGADGFVSIEVAPGLERDSAGTVEAAERLWHTVDRPNVMIKVPGTPAGAVAVQRLVAAGVNVNITLLFSLDAYRSVIDAYMSGLEERLRAGKPINTLRSVASFFVSRVDALADQQLEAKGAPGTLMGTAAIANAKLAYRLFQESLASARWRALAAKGATVQRPLWASTSTKNPAYRDVRYVEELIAPDTVNTMSMAVIDAFRDHGRVARTADRDVDQAVAALAAMENAGVSLAAVTDQLLTDGIASFQKSFDAMIAGLRAKTRSLGRDLVASH